MRHFHANIKVNYLIHFDFTNYKNSKIKSEILVIFAACKTLNLQDYQFMLH